jgi:hypothetical protein
MLAAYWAVRDPPALIFLKAPDMPQVRGRVEQRTVAVLSSDRTRACQGGLLPLMIE